MESNDLLGGKNIVMIVSGSISAYRTPDIIRDLKRSGARVKVILSSSAEQIIGREAMEWASEEPVITSLTGNMEHISLFDVDRENTVLLVCPATYNMIGKFAGGIADDTASTVFANALGTMIRTVIVPAMHMEMYESPVLRENMLKLKGYGVDFVSPRVEDGKAKLMWSEEIIDTILRRGNNNRTILIISGKSEVAIDPVRSLTNSSSGYTGICMAREAYRDGYDRIIYVGNSEYRIPYYCEFVKCNQTDEYYKIAEELVRNQKIDLIVIPAALSDFTVEKRDEKISSNESVSLVMKPREKLVDSIEGIMKSFKLHVPIIRFKLTNRKYVPETPDQVTVVNMVQEKPFGVKMNRYVIYDGEKKLMEKDMGKEELASILIKIGDGIIEKH